MRSVTVFVLKPFTTDLVKRLFDLLRPGQYNATYVGVSNVAMIDELAPKMHDIVVGEIAADRAVKYAKLGVLCVLPLVINNGATGSPDAVHLIELLQAEKFDPQLADAANLTDRLQLLETVTVEAPAEGPNAQRVTLLAAPGAAPEAPGDHQPGRLTFTLVVTAEGGTHYRCEDSTVNNGLPIAPLPHDNVHAVVDTSPAVGLHDTLRLVRDEAVRTNRSFTLRWRGVVHTITPDTDLDAAYRDYITDMARPMSAKDLFSYPR